MKPALDEALAAERALAHALRAVGSRHRDDHDIFHMTRTLATWSERNAQRLERHGAEAGEPPDVAFNDGPLALVLDLRDVHLVATRASVAWIVLGQGAQAVRDADLFETVTTSQPETIRAARWALQRLKEATPQLIAGER